MRKCFFQEAAAAAAAEAGGESPTVAVVSAVASVPLTAEVAEQLRLEEYWGTMDGSEFEWRKATVRDKQVYYNIRTREVTYSEPIEVRNGSENIWRNFGFSKKVLQNACSC